MREQQKQIGKARGAFQVEHKKLKRLQRNLERKDRISKMAEVECSAMVREAREMKAELENLRMECHVEQRRMEEEESSGAQKFKELQETIGMLRHQKNCSHNSPRQTIE